MAESTEWTFEGYDGGERVARTWLNEDPRYVALLCHGYGEHIGRYEYVADRLVAHGAIVHGMDHVGHGKSAGERVLVTDFEPVVEDFHVLDLAARAQNEGLPVVLVGHSMGGMIAARYAQVYGDSLAALVLSGPVVGSWAVLGELLSLEEIPDVPIDTATLSRDESVGTAYAADPLVWHGPFQRPTLEALQAAIDRIREAGRLGEVPTLWVHGEEDQLVPIEPSRAGVTQIKGANLARKTYPGARHEIFNETNKDEVLDDVTGFIDEQIGRDGPGVSLL
ncbi:MAG TPA: alpha/beta hydrolase [Nocardioidaceae bacterium]|nr:alpha/beta hydrolase [Nocardioidaceae bacterium]